MSTVLSSMVSIFNTNNTAIIAPKKRSSLFSRMFGATDVSTSTPKKIRGRYESDDESEYESGDDDDAFDMLPSDDTHSGERLYTLAQRNHYHSDTLSFSFTKSDSSSQHYLTPCGGEDLPSSLSAPTLFRKVSSEIKRSLGLKRSPGTQSTPNFLGGAILPEGSTPPPSLLPEQSPPKHWLGAKRFPGLKRDPSTSSKNILDFEMPKRGSLRTQSTLHFQEEYEAMPMAKGLKTQSGLRTQSCLDFEEEFAAWDDEEEDSIFSLSESGEEKPAPKSMKRMLISFKAERERVVIWNTVSIDSLPDSYKRSELRKEMRMKNQQTGNGFGGARVPSIRSTPRYGSQLTPRSSALEQMQVESDLEGESEKNTTGEVVAYVELRQNRKVPPSHAVIGSRARAWSAPAQIPGPSSRKAAIMEMQRECLVDTEKYGEESVEATFPEKVQTNEKMKNVSGAIPPTLWGSPNEENA